MVTRIGGARRKTRQIYKKHYRNRGKLPLRKYLQELKVGDRVVLQAETSVQKGIYFRRFHGYNGTVLRKLGTCYEVQIKDGNKEKRVTVHPVHLKRLA